MTMTGAYQMLFGTEPQGLAAWQITVKVLEGLNVDKLGRPFSRWILQDGISSVNFPDDDTRREAMDLASNYEAEVALA